MPVICVECPDCEHTFKALVLAGTRQPEIWECSKCGSREAAPKADEPEVQHPWESEHRSGCPCCGF